MPTMDELKNIVFSMDPNSVAGPDGMNGKFFQTCWDVIKEDLFKVIQAFFCGQIIPKCFSHAYLFLLSKVKYPNKISEFRSIILVISLIRLSLSFCVKDLLPFFQI